jgi:WD40 repeat protein
MAAKKKTTTAGRAKKSAATIDTLALSADRNTLVAAGSELRAYRRDGETWNKIASLKTPAVPLRHVALNELGSILYGATKSDVTRTRLGESAAMNPLLVDSEEEVRAIALRHDGGVLAVCVGDAVSLFNTKGGTLMDQRRGSAMQACAFSEDGSVIVGVNDKGAITLLDADSLKRTGLVATSDARLRSLAMHGDVAALGSLNPKNPIKVFSIWKKRTLHTLDQHANGGVVGIAFSPDGSRLASIGEDDHVRVWDTGKKKLILDVQAEGGAGPLRSVFFLSDRSVAAGPVAVASTKELPVSIWET